MKKPGQFQGVECLDRVASRAHYEVDGKAFANDDLSTQIEAH
jgi:hypothetical protein